MKTLKLGVCFLDEEDNIISKRVIWSHWSVNIDQDLKDRVNLHVEDEIAAILTENLKIQLTPETVKTMLLEIKERNKECKE